MQPLSPPLSRALAVTLLVAVTGGVWGLAVGPVLGAFQDAGDSIDQVSERLERYRRAGSDHAELERVAAEQRRRWQESGVFLVADNPALAAANLQKTIKDIVGRQQAALRSVQPLPPKGDGRTEKVAVRVRLETDTAALQRIIHEVESASPYLFLDQVDIRAQAMGAQMRGPAILEVQADIYGYMRSARK
ncbi:MAG TPA: type II secretion system protein GspM [Azospirillum sp.]|nr:type II secretion system protein GspM [Azospirillum sp.]